MYEGVLVAESLRPGTTLDGLRLAVRTIRRVAVSEPTPDQPHVWTLLDFQLADADTDHLAETLATALDDRGWYADFRSAEETVVVYPQKLFRYARGDGQTRAAAVAYGRSLGIPDAQLDWPV